MAGALATAATAAFFREPRRVPPPCAGVVLAPPTAPWPPCPRCRRPRSSDLPRDPVRGSASSSRCWTCTCSGSRWTVGCWPSSTGRARFLSADLDKASEDNERNALLLEIDGGARVGVVQIAGLLARRIVCDVRPGDEVGAGETYGLIRFGSRVDTYLPPGSRVTVSVGQRTIGGETVLAELPAETDGHVAYPAGVRLLPNAVTVLALCSGMSAVYFALGGRFELCVAAVGAAALCDALDGRLARLLDATTRIGAELDSLSDLVSFGVAPALVLYVWQLEETASAGPWRWSSRCA